MTIPSSINNPMTGNGITISTWVKASGNSFTGLAGIVTQQYTGGSVRFAIYGTDTGLVVGFYGGPWYTWYTLNENGSFPFGAWTLITTTYDGSTIKLYINGILNNSSSLNQPLPAAGINGWNIGKRWDIGDYFSGQMSEVRIYNEALTSMNVYTLYALGAAKHGIALNTR